MSETSIYAQANLRGRHFRLLFIQPAYQRLQKLECYCLPFEIDGAPPYDALSYVWGSPEPCTEILCNGKSIVIRSELANALMNLRLEDSTRIVWADAICINQGDSEERNHQVPLMGSIYSLARKVVVWLGHGDLQQVQEAFDCVKLIADACRQYDHDHNLDLDKDNIRDTIDLHTASFSPTVCNGLQELYSRPWFSRIWCVQEIRLAQDAFVLWGECGIPWVDLGLATSWIVSKTDHLDISKEPEPIAALLGGIQTLHADIMTDKATVSLLETLRSFHDWESSDPKDKVYGLLNLVSPRSEVEALNVDYNKTVGEVYADTALALIQLYSRLTPLAYIVHPYYYGEDDGDGDYRSWAPRWNDLGYAKLLGIPELECPWSACNHRMVTMTDADRTRLDQLCLRGIVFERVEEVQDVMDDDNLLDPQYAKAHSSGSVDSIVSSEAESRSVEMHPLLKFWKKFTKDSLPGACSEESRQLVYSVARTMTAGTFGVPEKYVQDLDMPAQKSYYISFLHFMLRLDQIHVSGHEGEYSHDAGSTQIQRDVYHACRQRCLFWTESKTFGLGPQCMDVDDIVVVLYGGNTPYVLRPKGDKYLFIGQAYVDNIMNGELVHSLNEGKVREEVFCLV